MKDGYRNPNEYWYYKHKMLKSEISYKACFYSLIGMIVILIILVLLTGCKSIQYVPVPEYHHDSIYFTKVQFDSIYQHDSIYVKEYTKGDTVFFEHIKWYTKYKEKEVHDTVYISKTDSISVPYPVEKQLTKWEKIKMNAGGAALLVCLISVVTIVVGLILRKRK